MNKISKTRLLVTACVILAAGTLCVAVNSSSTLAHEGDDTPALPGSPALEKKKAEASTNKTQSIRDQADEKRGRLEQAKLKICQEREKHIAKLRGNLSNYGQRHFAVLNQISERTQSFYKEKGLSISNYDALVADVNAKKAAVQAAVDVLKTSHPSFRCDGEDPKANAETFKENHRKVVAALKDYKTAVHNLFKAVKEAARATGGSQQ